MSTEDLKQHATSTHDFYELLGVSHETSEKDINRAYRFTSLKYHPDKHPGKVTEELLAKFHLIGVARDVLLDPEAKALHDKTRLARIQKQRQNDLLNGKRRTMKEDLERRESGFKRKRDEEADKEEQQERDIRRLAEEGRAKRMKMEQDRRKRDEEEQQASIIGTPQTTHTPQQAQAPEVERRIFIRFLREGAGLEYNEKSITNLFSRFGKIENAYILREKKTRLAGEKHKKLIATAAITFGSVFSAQNALEDGKALSELFIDINAGNTSKSENAAAPSTPKASPAFNKSFRSSIGSMSGLGASPSFSFSPAHSSPSNNMEATMMRLKAAQQAAERRELEKQIRREDAAEA